MSESVLYGDITVVSPDRENRLTVTPHAWVAVKDGRIACVKTSESEARLAFEGRQYALYRGENRILLPAFANTHNHMAMTLLRNSADDLELQRWLFDVIFPREERLNAGIVAVGSRLAMAEMIRSGTGASADMYYFHEETVQAALEAGFRLNISVDVKRPDPTGTPMPDSRILEDQLRRYARDPLGLLQVSMLVHSVYLYADALYPQLADIAEALDCSVQVHVAETEKEVQECLARYGRKPAAQLAHFGFFKTATIAAHCVHLDAAERRILAEKGVFAAHCPASNLKLGSGIADVAAMQQDGITVVLGTDGPASNNNLDLYRDLRLASFLAKGTTGNAAILPAEAMLRMVTTDGMAGLGFVDSGRIAAGWQADLQVIRTDSPGMTPLGNPISALVYSAAGSDVESLMVAGRWLMYHRELKTLDEEKIRYEANAAAEKLIG